MNIFWTLFSKLSLKALSLRYKIEVKGLEKLVSNPRTKKGGILFLPNHPAHMDPLFLFLLLWPTFRIRPLIIEHIYRLSILKPLVRLVKGLSIPNFETSVNQIKVQKAQKSIQAIADGLKKGENFILYPSGKLKPAASEVIGGASSAHALIQECPDTHVVLIRTTGLWGSSFSRALTGVSPPLPKTLWFGFKVLLKNGIFFAPRRKVLIEIEDDPQNFPRKSSRIEFNRFLENWYNQYPDSSGKIHTQEPLLLISYTFWNKKPPSIETNEKKKIKSKALSISPQTTTKVYEEIRSILENPSIEIRPEMRLALDLGMDSLNIAEAISFLARQFNAEDIHPEDIETVQDMLNLAETSKTTKKAVKQAGIFRFPKETNRPAPTSPVGKTIPEAFLRISDLMNSFVACADDLLGPMTYKKMKKAILVLASHFQKIEDKHIAVLLPSSATTYLVILALLFARKVPVMLNWTLGPRYLDEMMRLSNAKITLTSWRFIERLSNVEFGNLTENVQFLEDIKESLSLETKLKGVFYSFMPTPFTLKFFGLQKIKETDPAVILFTSGTEANPKGVPLSHQNILSNQVATMQCIQLSENDTIYGILPPFHSFGFSVAGIFPLIAGLKVAFYPDPTDSFALVEGIQRWPITLFCSAPSFLKSLFIAAKPHQLDSVRLFISGAEKAPQSLFDHVNNLKTNAKLIEGYGITECSPILSLNRLNMPPRGVGNPLPNVEVCTIHPETEELLNEGKEGELCVRGPNIFSGYLENPRTPFIEIKGKKWYRTGDIGYLDKDNFLYLSGRLKRFTKIGGEMISLTAIEEVLLNGLIKEGVISVDTPSLAVCADERISDKPQIVVFTTANLTKEHANDILKEAGLSRLIKISYIHQVEEIPIMGTGKIHYRKLQSLIE